jgi:hypothetical protein
MCTSLFMSSRDSNPWRCDVFFDEEALEDVGVSE